MAKLQDSDSVPDVCIVNAGDGVLEPSLVDAFDHCLGEMEPAAGNGYIAEHGLTVVNAKNLRLSCHCFILALLIAVVDFSQTCLLLTYV